MAITDMLQKLQRGGVLMVTSTAYVYTRPKNGFQYVWVLSAISVGSCISTML